MAKSLILTYIFWLFGGIFGLHHFYLNRDKHAFAMWMSFGGYFGLGWFRDLWRIPEYVRDANEDPEFIAYLGGMMRKHPKPPTGFARHAGTIIIADILGYLAIGAIPKELLPFGETLVPYISAFVAPLAIAIGIYTVGNIGRQKGSFKSALIGAYMTAPLYIFFPNSVFWTSLISNYLFNKYSKDWRRTPLPKKAFFKRVAILFICSLLYISLWSSWLYFNCSITDKNEQEVKCRDAAGNFFKSPAWKEFNKVWDDLRVYFRVHGWSGLWREIVQAFDPQGEVNALKTLGLSSKATQEEITTKYRKLSRQWHPDKHKDPTEKQLAQEKFIEIQQAYEILSRIKHQRIGKNKKSEL